MEVAVAAEGISAVAIQEAIDEVAAGGGGRVVLPKADVLLDRGLELRSGVELCGQGRGTVLRKGPGRVWPLSGYHNASAAAPFPPCSPPHSSCCAQYGMCDAPLESVAGLEVGMTVSVHDSRTHGGFYETFARVLWVDEQERFVGLDHGIEADCASHQDTTTGPPPDENPKP